MESATCVLIVETKTSVETRIIYWDSVLKRERGESYDPGRRIHSKEKHTRGNSARQLVRTNLCLQIMAQKMSPPTLVSKDPTSLSIKWDRVDGAEGYRVRVRGESDPEWAPISSTTPLIKGEAVKKKNLESGRGYFFSVIPTFGGDGDSGDWGWSPSSEKMVPGIGLSSFMQQLWPRSLVKQRSTVVTASALEGKVVGVYFSASWCGPCRQFTPLLAEAYEESKRAGKAFEIIFVSCDRDEKDWEAYYQGHHPWLSVAYSDPQREALADKFAVRGIPRLCMLKPSGEVLQDNVGPFTAANVDSWIRQCGL